MSSYKQAIIIRDDLDMTPGKAVAQGAHVSVLAVRETDDAVYDAWCPSMPKITLAADDQEQIQYLEERAESIGLPVAHIRDEGRTELESGTLTAVAIGPAEESDVNSITGDLSLY